MKSHLTSILFLLCPFLLIGQSAEKLEISRAHLVKNHESLGLTLDDVQELIVTDNYLSKHNGKTHIYFNQSHSGHKIHNAMINVTVNEDNSILHIGNSFVPDFRSQTISGSTELSAAEAVSKFGQHLGYVELYPPAALKSPDQNRLEFNSPDFSSDKIIVESKYIKLPSGEYRLTYEVYINEKDNSDSWHGYLDAETGTVLSQRQNTLYCQMEAGMYANANGDGCSHEHHHHHHASQSSQAPAALTGDGSAYFVLPLPVESPLYGDFEVVNEPAAENASPFGWHDEDGVAGPEWTITRGNNVWAYQDTATVGISSGDEPDGGDDLQFIFPWDNTLPVVENLGVDATNLFYTCNMLHDFAYQVGLDEPAGAFQNNNYGAGGIGNDLIFAETMDGSGNNNANFAPAIDGSNGRMQMFIYLQDAGIFRVTEPSSIASVIDNDFADWTNTPLPEEVNVKGELILVSDSDPQRPHEGCGELINDVTDKVAVILRGSCDFSLKAYNAQQAGAVGAIICNQPGINGGNGDELVNMTAGEQGENVTIPVVFIGNTDCVKIRNEMAQGPVSVEYNQAELMGNSERSGSLDNGTIAHEYGHGISHRLIGGPNTISCMSNGEQVGEGISDYMSLIMLVEPGDQGSDPRARSNYGSGLATTGGGIRRFPYSTDMNICPLTYDDIKGQTAPHPIGEVWAALLWDIYWEFVDLYGWDPDWNNMESGNMQAIRLAFDGMKLTQCGAGFVDMRDALIAADEGAHECMLWDVFARRGLGFGADQGDPDNIEDGIESYEGLPSCTPLLKVEKEVAQIVTPGQEMDVSITASNYTPETATNVAVIDILDEGMSVASVPSQISYTENGNEVTFELGDMASQEKISFTYQVATDPSKFSTTLIFNSMETSEERSAWITDRASGTANNFWQLNANDSRTGVTSYFAQERDEEAKQHLILKDLPIMGTRPVVRYWHRINTTLVESGGYVEYSDDGVIWNSIDDRFLSGGYNSTLAYANFTRPGLIGHSGVSANNEFQANYVDLTDEAGNTLDLRFVFGSYDLENDGMETFFFEEENGWFIDDVELMDLKTYETRATISADNADTQASELYETIIDSNGQPDSAEDLEKFGVSIDVFPNPADDQATVSILSENVMTAQIELSSMDGKLLMTQGVEILNSNNLFSLDLSEYGAGIYLVQVVSGNRISTKKLIIE